MDDQEPPPLQPRQLRYPSDLTDAEWAHIRPLIPASQARRRQTARGHAPGGQRRDVCPEYRMPVALHPEGSAAAQHGERLLLSVELQRHAWRRSTTRSTSNAASRPNVRPPHRLHHRQPKREERGKRGACIDPHGFDAGKLIKGKKRHVLVDTVGLLLHALVTSADVHHRCDACRGGKPGPGAWYPTGRGPDRQPGCGG